MRQKKFSRVSAIITGFLILTAPVNADTESLHGIAMYGSPALPPDFVSLPYVNPEAPKGGRVIFGNTGGFDSLNPFVQKGTSPWQLRFWSYESLMGRSWDEPFTLYGLLAESIRTADDRSWVEFTLRPEARFSDGTPVTVEDVIWSYETLGQEGHLRYRGFASQVEDIRQTGPSSVRISFNTKDRELALISGLRPILKKSQWEGKDFTQSGLDNIPIGTGAYVVSDFEAGRYVTLKRNPDYWAADLPLRRGTQNFDELRIEFYGDQTVLFEAFKAGELSVIREFNAQKWDTQYDFPAIAQGKVIKTEIPHQRPSGMTGFVMNSRRAPFDDWRVREALLLAFNFEYINDTVTGGAQPRIKSYFSNSALSMQPGKATGKVLEYLEPFTESLFPGTIEGYSLPVSDGTARNRGNLRQAMTLLNSAGWNVIDGKLRNSQGKQFSFDVLLRQGDNMNQTVIEIYSQALARLGIQISVSTVDDAQFSSRVNQYDFDMTTFRRELSLSPGNEQRLYWGSEGVDMPGSRNLMGVESEALDSLINQMLATESQEDFTAAVRALDRILTAGRFVIPIWQYDVGRIAHTYKMKYPKELPIYGDRTDFLPDVWWFEDSNQ